MEVRGQKSRSESELVLAGNLAEGISLQQSAEGSEMPTRTRIMQVYDDQLYISFKSSQQREGVLRFGDGKPLSNWTSKNGTTYEVLPSLSQNVGSSYFSDCLTVKSTRKLAQDEVLTSWYYYHKEHGLVLMRRSLEDQNVYLREFLPAPKEVVGSNSHGRNEELENGSPSAAKAKEASGNGSPADDGNSNSRTGERLLQKPNLSEQAEPSAS